MNKPMAYSHSSLDMYDKCPKKFQYLKVTKQVKPGTSEHLEYGNKVHKCISDYLSGISDNIMPDLQNKKAFFDMIRDNVRGGDCFYEEQVCLDRDLKQVSWFSKQAWMRGILDVFIDYGNEGVVLDWKTGKQREGNDQLLFYAALVMSIRPKINTVRTEFVWLGPNTITSRVYIRDQLPVMWREIMGKVNSVEESIREDVWVPKPSYLCRFCEAYDICEDRQG